MHNRAIILAGGRGARLRPYTVTIPKPLMPLGDTPILEIVIRQLVAANFRHITLAVNYQAEFIQAFLGDGSRWGAKIDFSLEQQPLGTMGPLRLISDLPQKFLVINGDILTDAPYSQFFETHWHRGQAAVAHPAPFRPSSGADRWHRTQPCGRGDHAGQ